MLNLKTTLGSEEVKLDGKAYKLHELTALEAEKYYADMVDLVDGKPVVKNEAPKVRLVAMALRNGSGKPAMTREQVGELPAQAVNRLYDAAARLSGMDRDAEERLGKD